MKGDRHENRNDSIPRRTDGGRRLLASANQCGTATDSANAGLKQAVESKLATDPQLAQIEVNTVPGENEVTLSGSVSTEQARNEAVEIARSANPNISVIDNIDVKSPAATGLMPENAREKAKALGDKIGDSIDDAWVYTKVEGKLVQNSAVPALKINVDVENNVVTLRGEVKSIEMKLEAERLARETEGVKAVRNLLQVKA